MATGYISVEPMTLAEVIELAEAQGYTVTVEAGTPTSINLLSEDERYGCYGMSEEVGLDGETHIGSMGNPKLDGLEMAGEGSEDYVAICGEE
ncbi:hypothetical protein [Brevundimonas sp. EAKA]|uniref:hypothetical protein n=1 Tax=Brevundimonas sp. EAKA TaxID=1495854 RepID=UPI000A55658C|nr:hypothetical protein [Brevundimonas sp. EAKA]